MQLPRLLVAAALSLVVIVGCSSGGGSNSGGGAPAAEPSDAGGGPSCDDACAYYLQCKGTDDSTNRAQCNSACANIGFTQQQLSDFVQTDCASAIAAVEGSGTSSSGGSGGGSSGGSSGSSCREYAAPCGSDSECCSQNCAASQPFIHCEH